MSCFQEHKEMQRVTSSNGMFDAVVIKTFAGGATVGVIYKVYIVLHGDEIKKKKKGESFLALRAYDIKVNWINEKKLVITYPEYAKILNFSNLSYFYQKDGSYEEILISLNPVSKQDD